MKATPSPACRPTANTLPKRSTAWWESLDATTDNYLTYGDEQSSYTLGLGNSMNTLGTLVGAMSGIQPAFWSAEKQDWVALPVGENDVLYGSIANGITADGKYICGSVAKGDYMTSEGTLNLVPVV